MLVLVAGYAFVTGAVFSAVVMVFAGDWLRERRAAKQRRLDARANLGRLAMRAEHRRMLAGTVIDLRGGWR